MAVDAYHEVCRAHNDGLARISVAMCSRTTVATHSGPTEGALYLRRIESQMRLLGAGEGFWTVTSRSTMRGSGVVWGT